MPFSNYGINGNGAFCGNVLLLFNLLKVIIMDEFLFEVKYGCVLFNLSESTSLMMNPTQ
jgi:hypothetical protein